MAKRGMAARRVDGGRRVAAKGLGQDIRTGSRRGHLRRAVPWAIDGQADVTMKAARLAIGGRPRIPRR
jgi:hypothetical protein